jgi:hypothetical protein
LGLHFYQEAVMDGFAEMDTVFPMMAGYGLVWLVGAAVVWLVVAIITAQVAQTKGYNAAGGFFAGLFLGVIGLVIYGCCADLIAQKHLARIVQLMEYKAQQATPQPPAPPAG